MAKHILDASVIIKWFINEEESDKALSYLEAFQNNKIVIIVPSLMFYELGNTIINKKGSVSMASGIMQKLQELNLEVEDLGLKSFRKIYQNAIEYSLTFYDAEYLTLMQKENCQFITADKKLYEKVKKYYTAIKLL